MDDDFNLANCFSDYDSSIDDTSSTEDVDEYIRHFKYNKGRLSIELKTEPDSNGVMSTEYKITYVRTRYEEFGYQLWTEEPVTMRYNLWSWGQNEPYLVNNIERIMLFIAERKSDEPVPEVIVDELKGYINELARLLRE